MPMFSQTTEYAIRAMIEIARQPEDESRLVRQLAERLEIPHFYLAKILHQLVRARILESVRGRGGGFRLAKPAAQIPLLHIVRQFEDIDKTTDCILGRPKCSDVEACPLHDFWRDVRTRYVHELESKSVKDLASHDDLWRSPGTTRTKAKRAPSARKPRLPRTGSVR
jgi:Rrf2 family protein